MCVRDEIKDRASEEEERVERGPGRDVSRRGRRGRALGPSATELRARPGGEGGSKARGAVARREGLEGSGPVDPTGFGCNAHRLELGVEVDAVLAALPGPSVTTHLYAALSEVYQSHRAGEACAACVCRAS